MQLHIQLTKNIASYLSKFQILKSMLFPLYEQFGVKTMMDKKRTADLQTHGLQTLTKITTLFHQANINYWLDYGTLLGIVRDKRLIQHDTDIDLGMLASDYSEKVDALLLDAGFSIWRTIRLADDKTIVEKTFVLNNIRVDLFLYQKTDNQMTCYAADDSAYITKKYQLNHGEHLAIPLIYDYQNTKTLTLNGQTFLIPADPSKYLEAAYGDWKVENKNFNYIFDSTAVSIQPDLKATIVYN